MGIIQRVVKPKTRKGKKCLLDREPKLVENPKSCIFVRGRRPGELGMKCAKDWCRMKKPHSVFFGKKHEMLPFEATNELEALCKKYDSSLFSFVSHSKKRPNNLIIGRMFDGCVLDMVEFGVEKYKGLDDFKLPKFAVGSKPCLTFAGEPFLNPSSEFYRIKNLFVDFFKGEEAEKIRLEGIEYVLSFTAIENKIHLRGYKIVLKKSGEKTPYVELEEMGPSVDLVLRRTKLASTDLFKSACKKPKELKPKKVKNISKDVFGSTLGQVHIPKQNLSKITTRRMKGLKKTIAEQKLEKANNVRNRGQPTENQPQVDNQLGTFVNTSKGAKSGIESVVNNTGAAGGLQVHLTGSK